jgi:hypothetical protein
LLTPRISVNWRRRKRTLFFDARSRMSFLLAPVVSLGAAARDLGGTVGSVERGRVGGRTRSYSGRFGVSIKSCKMDEKFARFFKIEPENDENV